MFLRLKNIFIKFSKKIITVRYYDFLLSIASVVVGKCFDAVKISRPWAVVVAQLEERSLAKPEVHCLNPVIVANTVKRKKDTGNGLI